MKRFKNSGSALVDYVIPTLVIGAIAGVALYNLVDSGVISKFMESSVNGKVDSNGVMVVK